MHADARTRSTDRSRWPAPIVASALLSTVLLALAPRVGAAQAVRGTVTDTTGRPLAGAAVFLVDTVGRAGGGVLTDRTGRFVLPASEGTWRVRAERVGSRTTYAPAVTVGASDTATVALVLSPAPRAAHALGLVRTRQPARCRIDPEAGRVAALYWEEVRKALTNTQLAVETNAFDYALERTARTFAPRDGRLLHEERAVIPQPGVLFASVAADSLARRGFIWRDGRADQGAPLLYQAPDARVLLSHEFVATHCLRAVPAPPARTGEVGLAFTPTPGRRLSDVEGTLWLDSASLALRALEYRYTRLPDEVREAVDARSWPGGRLAFQQRDDGLWYVSDWTIRLPLIEPGERLAPMGRRAGEAEPARTLHEVREVGGKVLTGDLLPRAPADSALVTGVLVDSTWGLAPLVGARLSRTDDDAVTLATTDSAGRFRAMLAHDGPGGRAGRDSTVTLVVRHPRLAVLGLQALVAPAPLVRGRETVLALAAPGARTVRARLCGPQAAADWSAVVTGAVRRALGAGAEDTLRLLQPEEGFPVRASWNGTGGFFGRAGGRQVRTDALGHFAVCAVPPDMTLEVRAGTKERFVERTEPGWLITLDVILGHSVWAEAASHRAANRSPGPRAAPP